MKKFKKLDNYLLENYPIIWASRFVPFVSSAIALWIFSLFFGFQSFGSEKVMLIDLHDHYFNSFFISIHIISMLVVVVFWAVSFYKHNAFRSLYPLEKWYFQKLFLFLLIPFSLLFTAYYPFTTGARWRASMHLDEQEMLKIREIVNEAAPFLAVSTEDYQLQNRSYPEPFPLKTISYDSNNQRWSNSNLYEVDNRASNGTISSIKEYTPAKNPITTVGINHYQFLETEMESVNSVPCIQNEIVKKTFSIDSEKYGISKNSVLNYSDLWLSASICSFNNSKANFSEVKKVMDRNDQSSNSKIYCLRYAPKVHRLVNTKDFSAIKKRIKRLDKALNQLKINHNLEADKIVRYLQSKDFKYLQSFVSEYDNHEESLERILYGRSISRFLYDSYTFEKQFEIRPGQYIDLQELRTLYINLKHTKKNHLFSRFSSSLLFFALGACFLFFILYVVRLRSFFLSIPIWGILNIIIGFVLASARMGASESTVVMGTYLFLAIVVVAINWWFLRDPKLSLKPLHISISMALFAIPAIGLLTLGIIETSFSTKTEDDCGQSISTLFLNGWLTNPYLFYFVALISILFSFYVLRIYKSKPE